MGNSKANQSASPKRNRKFIRLPSNRLGYVRGIILTLVLAGIAGTIANLPFFSIMGVMIISILLGISWKAIMPIPNDATAGITFSSKVLLRIGIILMGVRLNLGQIVEAGIPIIWMDITVVAFTICFILLLGKIVRLDQAFTTLLAVGTAICGAAAIVAVAPLIRAKQEFTALAVAFIAILGTIGTIFYTFGYAFIDVDSYQYGVFVGSTLHELAHVVAAAVPGGETSSEMAILVKMGRVALLIPVALIISFIFYQKNNVGKEKLSLKTLPIPWFIFGFLAMSMLQSFGVFSEQVIQFLIGTSVLFLSMAMAGLGLSIRFQDFKQVGFKGVAVGAIGSIAIALLGVILLWIKG